MKKIFKLIGVILLSLLLASDNPKAYSVFEQLLSNVIGVIVGGVMAAVALIFGLFAGEHFMESLNQDQKVKFKTFCHSLKTDIYFLLMLLGASVALPYFRNAGIPILRYPEKMEGIYSIGQFYSFFEILVLILAIQIVLEIVSVLFDIFDLKFSNH